MLFYEYSRYSDFAFEFCIVALIWSASIMLEMINENIYFIVTMLWNRVSCRWCYQSEFIVFVVESYVLRDMWNRSNYHYCQSTLTCSLLSLFLHHFSIFTLFSSINCKTFWFSRIHCFLIIFKHCSLIISNHQEWHFSNSSQIFSMI